MKRIQLERTKRGWTRAELARQTRIHPADIGKLESGKCYLWPAWEVKLAKIFNIPANTLLDELPAEDDGKAE